MVLISLLELVMKIVHSTSTTSNIQSSQEANKANHSWVTVINPTNHRLLLQACDDCGVVKSENSILKRCVAVKGQGLVSGRMSVSVDLVGDF